MNRLPLDKIEELPGGGLKIGATVRNSDLAHHPRVQRDYAVLSQAISPALPPSFATWPPPGEICSSARAACTSATQPCPATSASLDPDAQRSTGATALSRFSAPANIASLLIPPICAWPGGAGSNHPHRRPKVHAQFPSANFIYFPGTPRIAKQSSNRRPHHSRHSAAASFRQPPRLLEIARSRVIRICPCLRRGGVEYR